MRYFVLMGLLAFFPLAAMAETTERWAVYYTDALPAELFQSFDLIVFDSDSHPPLAALKAQHKILLGYLSLGEAESYRSYYQALKDKKLLLKANPQWEGHRVIDVRRPEWTDYVNDTLIPAVLRQGFDGIMIDTLDSVVDAQDQNPVLYKGMKEATVRMIKAIRAHYPHIKIMVNRGFELLPQIAGDIDMVMAESIYSDWAGKGKPALVPAKIRQPIVEQLKTARRQSPTLTVYTVDYWPPEDKKGVRRIYAAQRALGFIPYVATVSLQKLYQEPQ